MTENKKDTTPKIKISIITVSYNSAKTIRDTLESVRNQDFDNIEYIIVDGGSNDGTLDIISEYQDIISKIVSEPDHGISDAMNKGIRMATGDIIGIIHSDDMLYDGALKELDNVYDENIDVYYGDCVVCSDTGTNLHILKAKNDLSDMGYNFGLIHPSAFVAKKAYERLGAYSIKCFYAMDYELFLRYYKNGAKFKYLNKTLAIYRLGGTNQKNRRKTIKEVRDISISYGANPVKAEMIRLKKIAKDILRPLVKMNNKRVKPIV